MRNVLVKIAFSALMGNTKNILYIILFAVHSLMGQNGNITITESSFVIPSEILKEDRVCLISLPEAYHDPENAGKQYQLLILLDGSVHFKTASELMHSACSDKSQNNIIPETIIVAIENVDRERDFTVTKLKTKRVNTMGGGKLFLDFIQKELVPYLDKNYSTAPLRTLVGHSLGGLLTINSYMDSNSIFNAYIAMDPSIWWDEETMKTKVADLSQTSFHKKLYIATANQGEANYERNKIRHEQLYDLINQKSNEKANIKLEYFENENHRSVPFIALEEGLNYLHREN